MDNFGQWLLGILEERELSQSDLSRMAGISRGTLSNIISGNRGRGFKSLAAIAKALKIPREQIYRAAGLLPPSVNIDEQIEIMVEKASGLPEEDRDAVLKFIEILENRRKKK